MSPEILHQMFHIMWLCIGINFITSLIYWFKGNNKMVMVTGCMMALCLAVAIGLLKYGS